LRGQAASGSIAWVEHCFEQRCEHGTIGCRTWKREDSATDTYQSGNNHPTDGGGDVAGFGARLRKARLAARGGVGLGQVELGELLGVSQAAVSDYERGRRQPNLATLAELARLLDVAADWLLTGGVVEQDSTSADSRQPSALLDRSLADVIGVAALPDLGKVGLLSHGAVRLAAQSAAGPAESLPIAAETAPPYLSGAPGRPAARIAPSTTAYAVDRALAGDAEAIAHYAGPACGPLRPGDVLLVARTRGRQGLRLLRRAARPSDDAGPAWVVEELPVADRETNSASPGPQVAAGERIIGVLRWF